MPRPAAPAGPEPVNNARIRGRFAGWCVRRQARRIRRELQAGPLHALRQREAHCSAVRKMVPAFHSVFLEDEEQ